MSDHGARNASGYWITPMQQPFEQYVPLGHACVVHDCSPAGHEEPVQPGGSWV